jgi:ferredoxin
VEGGTRATAGAPYLVRTRKADEVRQLPAVRVRLPAQGHQDHAARGRMGPADRECGEDAAEFEINMLRCIFCGLCQEVCPEEAIFLQQDYSLTG